MCTSSVSNVIYHKFSHGAAFYTLNGKNVNVMLESRTAIAGDLIFHRRMYSINNSRFFFLLFFRPILLEVTVALFCQQ